MAKTKRTPLTPVGTKKRTTNPTIGAAPVGKAGNPKAGSPAAKVVDPDTLQCYRVCPTTQTVSSATIGRGCSDIAAAIGSEYFVVIRVSESTDIMYLGEIDEEIDGPPASSELFVFDGTEYTGTGIVVGVTADGDNAPPTMTIEEIWSRIKWHG